MSVDRTRENHLRAIADADPAVLDGLRIARAMSKMSEEQRRRLVAIAEAMVSEPKEA